MACSLRQLFQHVQRQRVQNDGKINARTSYSSCSSSVRMEELRDLNKSVLSAEETRARECELLSRRKTIVSGGLQGATPCSPVQDPIMVLLRRWIDIAFKRFAYHSCKSKPSCTCRLSRQSDDTSRGGLKINLCRWLAWLQGSP